VIKLDLHPYQQAAAFLACTKTPDFVPFRRSFMQKQIKVVIIIGFLRPRPVLLDTLATPV
jgi:hypothetical protein